MTTLSYNEGLPAARIHVVSSGGLASTMLEAVTTVSEEMIEHYPHMKVGDLLYVVRALPELGTTKGPSAYPKEKVFFNFQDANKAWAESQKLEPAYPSSYKDCGRQWPIRSPSP